MVITEDEIEDEAVIIMIMITEDNVVTITIIVEAVVIITIVTEVNTIDERTITEMCESHNRKTNKPP